jgi:hypothetical protein
MAVFWMWVVRVGIGERLVMLLQPRSGKLFYQ